MTEAYSATTEKLINPETWKIRHTDTEQTGIRLFSIDHPNPETIPTTVWIAEPNDRIDPSSTLAWAGARTSRSQDSFEEIFTEIADALKENPEFAAQKIAKVFEGYGHQSVGDMAPVFIYINKIPIHLAFEIFYSVSVGAGQESSTRYITFDNLGIDSPDLLLPMNEIDGKEAEEIRVRWETLQKRMGEKYKDWYGFARDAYTQQFGTDISENTINSRALDIARLWIPQGATTSMALLMSTRDWVRMIRILGETNDIRNRSLSKQLLQGLKLSDTKEAEDFSLKLGTLLKYHEPTYTISKNVILLREFLMTDSYFIDYITSAREKLKELPRVIETSVDQLDVEPGEGTALQYIMEIFPELDEYEILGYLRSIPVHMKIKIGEIILRGHNQHDLMTNKGDIRGRSIFSVKSAAAYIRDFNRHRAFGRFTPLFGTANPKAILATGFNANYQIFGPNGLNHLQRQWEKDFHMLYQELGDLADIITKEIPINNGRWLLRLLPLGHQIKFHMSAPPTQFNYLIAQRENRPGDYGYVHIAHELLRHIRKDPFFTNMLADRKPVDLTSKKEFTQRK